MKGVAGKAELGWMVIGSVFFVCRWLFVQLRREGQKIFFFFFVRVCATTTLPPPLVLGAARFRG
jgi:hypothetical protein